MPLVSLKQLCIASCQKHIKRLETFGDEGMLPATAIAQLLKHVLPDQLLRLEEKSPWLAQTAEAQVAWQQHVMRVFPTCGDDYELGDPQLDWRAAFAFLTKERQLKEEASRQRLREKYKDLSIGKQGKQIKTLDKVPPIIQGRRPGAGAGVSKPRGSLLGKAMKSASLASMRIQPSKPKALSRPAMPVAARSTTTTPARTVICGSNSGDRQRSKFLMVRARQKGSAA
jgi:hypothetical protein